MCERSGGGVGKVCVCMCVHGCCGYGVVSYKLFNIYGGWGVGGYYS